VKPEDGIKGGRSDVKGKFWWGNLFKVLYLWNYYNETPL
jgi:hypothetical protein